MVISMRKTALFLVISLVTAVISLETEARAATFPSQVTVRPTWVPPAPGFGAVPGKIAKDASDNFYVVDVVNRSIVKFDARGAYKETINVSSFGRPYGLGVMKDGTLVVTFLFPKPQVVMFSSAGTKLQQQGDLPTQLFQAPVAVAFDSQENIYVLDQGYFNMPVYMPNYPATQDKWFVPGTSKPGVYVFTKAGAAVATGNHNTANGYATNTFGFPAKLNTLSTAMPPENGAFTSPEAIVYDSARKQILVADTLNGRVEFFGAADYTANPADRFKWLANMGSIMLNGQDMHLVNPSGMSIENHVNGDRLYVIDKVRRWIKVFDLAAKTYLGKIEHAQYPDLDLVYPRDLLSYKGNLLVSSEQGVEAANLRTVSLEGAAWPPAPLTLTFDYERGILDAPGFPNVTQKASNTFTVYGTVDAGATMTWACNEGEARQTSGACTVTVAGGSRDNYSCPLIFVVPTQDQNCVVRAVKGADTGSLALPHMNYTTSTSLTIPGPVLTFNAIPAADQFRASTMITVSGTVDYTASNNGKELEVQILNSATGKRTSAVVDTNGGAQPAKNWTANVELVPNQVNTLTPSAYTELSARTGSVPVSQDVVVDTIAPTVDFGFYGDGFTTMDQVQNAAGTVFDANLESVTLDVNGTKTTVRAEQVGVSQHYFSALALLNKNGLNSVQVTARDKAGNQSASPVRTVTLDPMVKLVGLTRLTVDATAQADNLFYPNIGTALAYQGDLPSGTTAVRFGVEDGTVNGTRWDHSTTTYVSNSAEVVVPIVIEATGSYGKVSKLRTLYLHADAPGLAITSPAEDKAVKVGTAVSFSGKATRSATNPASPITQVSARLYDSNGTEVHNFGSVVPNAAGDFTLSSTFNLTEQGVYTLVATATNGVGQTTIAHRNLMFDTTPPSVGIALDYTPNPATIQGYVEPGATVKVVYDGVNQDVAMSGSVWSVNAGSFIDLSKLQVTATDVAANTNVRTWQAIPPNADLDGDGTLRIYDAIIALRAVTSGTADVETLKHADIAPVVSGLPAPDGMLTLADAQLVLMKVEGKNWQ